MNIIPESQTIYYDIRELQWIKISIIYHDNPSEKERDQENMAKCKI
jgi:hypothetical protein